MPAPLSWGGAGRPVRARLRLRARGGPLTPGLRPDVRVPQGAAPGGASPAARSAVTAPRVRHGAGLRESAHALRRAGCWAMTHGRALGLGRRRGADGQLRARLKKEAAVRADGK